MVLAMLFCVPTAMYEKNATAGSDYTAICGSEVFRPKERPYQIINFYAAPLRGKSTRLGGIFFQRKKTPKRKGKPSHKKTDRYPYQQQSWRRKPHTAQDSIPFERMYRTGFAALQTGGIPSALSLKILTISLRSRTTRPPFLKPFAICITLLTLLSVCSFP